VQSVLLNTQDWRCLEIARVWAAIHIYFLGSMSWSASLTPIFKATLSGDLVGQAARFSPISAQIFVNAVTRWSMSASLWSGDGVIRSRSVRRGTVG
jgi:hypothetical protein